MRPYTPFSNCHTIWRLTITCNWSPGLLGHQQTCTVCLIINTSLLFPVKGLLLICYHSHCSSALRCYNPSFSFYFCFTCTFLYFFTPVWSLFGLCLAFYMYFSFTLFKAAHLTQSSCSTMMTPFCFLTPSNSLLYINTQEIVVCTLTYSWEYIPIFSSLSNLAS